MHRRNVANCGSRSGHPSVMSKRIAIVEDEQAIRENYASAFRREGYSVEMYEARQPALDAFDARLPDLVVIDINLKDEVEGGFELCRELRSRSADLPIIFLTARDSEFDAVSGLRLGADDYLTKPVNPTLLKARIKSGLETKQWLDTERQQKRFIRQAFSRFLAQAVVDALVEDPSKLELGGERVEITCLFTDLEGFTSLIEGAEPGKVLPLLNRYLDSMCRIVLDHGGTIDKIVGDALHEAAEHDRLAVTDGDHRRHGAAVDDRRREVQGVLLDPRQEDPRAQAGDDLRQLPHAVPRDEAVGPVLRLRGDHRRG